MKMMARFLIAAAASGILAAVAGCSVQAGEEQSESTSQAICMNCVSGGSSSGGGSGSSSGGVVIPKRADGVACTAASQCSGGYCQSDVCTSACTSWSQCPEGMGCGSNGLCVAETSAPQCAPAPAVSGAGGACATDLDCNATGNLVCSSGTCTAIPATQCSSSAQCPLGSYCTGNYFQGEGTCTNEISGSWSGWTYTTNGVPVLECGGTSAQIAACNDALFPSTYLANAQCPAGLTCLDVTANGNTEFGCFDLGSQPSGAPPGATGCTASSQCPAGQGCWVQEGASTGSCITPCNNDVAQSSTLYYAAGQLNPATDALAFATIVAKVTPATTSAPSPTARMIEPPCSFTPNPTEDSVQRNEAVTWAAAESAQFASYAPAQTFAARLASDGCAPPMMLWGTGLADNYVFYAVCPAGTTTDSIVFAAACDSVINAIEFSSVSCQLEQQGLVLQSTTMSAGTGSVFVEWDPHGGTND